MGKRGGFDNVRIYSAQRIGFILLIMYGVLGEPSGNLSDFQSVSQAVAEDDSLTGCGYLGNAAESSESGCVQNPIPVTLSFCPPVGRAVIGIEPIFAAW